MKKTLLALSTALLITACNSNAGGPDADPFEAQDPIRPFNEAMFSFNLGADEYVIHPVAKGYHALPEWFRYGSSNFVSNLSEPLSAVNSLVQLDFQSFGTSLFRFLLNTTFGLGGVRDFAGENGLAKNKQTFNQTFSHYGVDTGPYIVLPLLGPSSARDVTGRVGDWFADPLNYYMTTWESVGEGAAQGIITRDQNAAIIDQLYYESIDPYTATRAAYLQHGAVKSPINDSPQPK